MYGFQRDTKTWWLLYDKEFMQEIIKEEITDRLSIDISLKKKEG